MSIIKQSRLDVPGDNAVMTLFQDDVYFRVELKSSVLTATWRLHFSTTAAVAEHLAMRMYLEARLKHEDEERAKLEAERDELLKALYDPAVAAKHFAEDLELE